MQAPPIPREVASCRTQRGGTQIVLLCAATTALSARALEVAGTEAAMPGPSPGLCWILGLGRPRLVRAAGSVAAKARRLGEVPG